MFKSNRFIFFLIFLIIFCSSTFIPIFSYNYGYNLTVDDISFDSNFLQSLNSSKFSWPTPGYNTITSYFGYRKAPTSRCF